MQMLGIMGMILLSLILLFGAVESRMGRCDCYCCDQAVTNATEVFCGKQRTLSVFRMENCTVATCSDAFCADIPVCAAHNVTHAGHCVFPAVAGDDDDDSDYEHYYELALLFGLLLVCIFCCVGIGFGCNHRPRPKEKGKEVSHRIIDYAEDLLEQISAKREARREAREQASGV